MKSAELKNRKPTKKELENLILIALAKREQMASDGELSPLTTRRAEFTGNVRRIARFEGWRCSEGDVDAAVQRLTAAGMMATDRDPAEPGQQGPSARLSATGYARALTVSRDYLGEPLLSFKRDQTFDDNGIGQIEIDFLGQRIVIGCVEGEEDRTIEFAHRFEVDTGGVLKAVAGLDDSRAMLMAGVLSYEHIENLEAGTRGLAPASDRIVGLDHNSAAYLTAVAAVDQLIVVVRESNVYREADPEDQERRIAELEAGRRLLGSKWLSLATVKAALVGTVTYLAAKFADAPIGEAAAAAWSALKALLGLQ
ncbi:hypothetical protein NKH85_18900 [Mesorhizobium sp. M0924]|uniref:hypothetical protein n=1 Tax=unclassified Mesorhizobium TaxID=325217 RepID=UPI0033354A41